MYKPNEGARRVLEGGWCLQAIGDAQRTIRIVLGDTALAHANIGLVIGRHPALCDRTIDDPTISHRHCRFSVREGQLFVEDLNSLNGTLVDGQPLPPFDPEPVAGRKMVMLGRLEMAVTRLGDEQG